MKLLFSKTNATTFWLFVSVFLFSLGSYYFYQIGLYAFQLIGVAIAFPFFRLRYLGGGRTRLALISLFFIYIFLVGATVAVYLGSSNFGPIKLTLPIFVFGYLAFSAVIFRIYPLKFQRILFAVILIHAGFFIFQFIWFFATGDVIDFLKPFTGEEQRVIGGTYAVSFLPNFARMSGLFNEPGTYSSWMMLLLLLYRANAKRLHLDQTSYWLDATVMLTLLSSFSTYGAAFTAIYMFAFLFEKKLDIKSLAVVFGLMLLFTYVGFEYFQQRFTASTGDTGVQFRHQAIYLYFDNLDAVNLFFGLGIFNDFFARADSELVAQDVGLWFSLLTGCGVAGVSLFLIFFRSAVPRDIYSYCLMLVLILSKFTLTTALVWVVLFYFVFSRPGSRFDSPKRTFRRI